MQVLLVFNREDPFIITLKNAIIEIGSTVKCCKNIQETHDAFKKVNYDLVFIDTRRSTHLHISKSSTSSSISNAPGSHANTNINANSNQYDYENICRFIRNLFHYTVIVALTHNFEDRDVPNILPFLKIGFNKMFAETTNLKRCINELLTLEYGEIASFRRLQAAHALFTALEFTNDPIEIMNDQFRLLYANNAFEKLTGLTLNEISGHSFNQIHKLNSNECVYKEITPGTAWECLLPFPKQNGEIQNFNSVTIPVIVQGETNKILNYVTITNLSDKAISNSVKYKKLSSSKPGGEETQTTVKLAETSDSTTTTTSHLPHSSSSSSIKKLSSFVLPKKSYDYDKFALDSLPNADDNPSKIAATTTKYDIAASSASAAGIAVSAPAAAQRGEYNNNSNTVAHANNNSISLSSNIDASSIDDNKSINTEQRSTDFLNSDVYKSSSEFNNSFGLNESNAAQRKRSYEVHPITHETLPRRHSMAKVHQQTIEAPIRKVINIICLAHEKSTTDIVRQNLDKALDILRSTELYNPALIENDKHTSDLVSGLMSNGLQKRVSITNVLGTKPLFNYVSSSSQNYVKNLSSEIIKLLEKEEQWNFDIIELERLTNFRPLVTLGLKTMNRFGVCEYLKIEENLLVNWLTLIESNYRQTNPYHNSTHAGDVLHASAFFLSTDKISDILDETDKVASLLAAAVHDLNHPGRTNAFLCNSNNDLAILYNDQAVLENHHTSLAFQLTRQNQDANIFKNLTRDEYRAMRSIIIDMVLATEMNKHFEHLNKFLNKFGITDEEKAPIKSLDMLKAPENKVLIKRMLIKCADVNNPCRPLDIYKEWTNRISNEYFDQTDEEKLKGLPVVMATYDRSSCNIPKAQISFIEYFINDMFEAWDEFIYLPELIANLQANTVYWRECADALAQKEQQQNAQANKSLDKTCRANSIIEDGETDNDK